MKILIAILLLAGMAHCRPVYSGGGPEEGMAQGGDCYRAHRYPVNWQQAKVMQEKGWQELPLEDKLRVSQLVSESKAEILWVPEHRKCGPFLGEMKVYATWFWRAK